MKFDIDSLKELAGLQEQKFVGKDIKPAKFAVGATVCVKNEDGAVKTKGRIQSVKHADKSEKAPNRYVINGKTYDEDKLIRESLLTALIEAEGDVELTEGARLVGKLTSDDGSCVAKVYRNSEWDEFFVKFEKDGRTLFADEESDGLSYADSKEEATSQAQKFIDRINSGDTKGLIEGHSIIPRSPEDEPDHPEHQGELAGLEGPFKKKTKSGDYVVVYYDPKEGKYYNRRSDLYYSNEEAASLFESEEIIEAEKVAKVPELNDFGKDNIDNNKNFQDATGATQDQTPVKVPAGLFAAIDKRVKEIEKSKDEYDKTKYMEHESGKDKAIDCLAHLKELLTNCTIEKHKEAVLYFHGISSNVTHLFPASLVKFLHKAEENVPAKDTTVYPQVAKSSPSPD